MNRNLLYSIIVILVTLFLGYYAFSKHDKGKEIKYNNLDLIPYNSSVLIVEMDKPFQEFSQILNSNLIWKKLILDSDFKKIESFFNLSDSIFHANNLTPSNLTFALCESNGEKELFFVLKMQEKVDLGDNILDKNWHIKSIQDRLLVSSSQELINGVEEQLVGLKSIINEEEFSEIFLENVKKANKTSIFINHKKFKNVLDLGNQSFFQTKKFGWGMFDLSLKTESVFINGYILNSQFDEISNEIDETFFEFIPLKFKEVMLFNMDTNSQFPKDTSYLEKISKACKCDVDYHGYNWIENQVTYFRTEFNDFKYIALKVSSVRDFKESLEYLTPDSLRVLETNNPIKNNHSLFDFSKLIQTSVNLTHYIWWKNNIIFGESEQALNRILFQIDNKKVLSKSKEIVSFFKNNSSENSMFTRLTRGGAISEKLTNNGVSLLQLLPESDNKLYASYSYTVEIGSDGQKNNNKWALEMGSKLQNSIYLIKNHRTNDAEYLFQAVNNELVMVSPIGKIKWRKKLDSKIIGEIKNIDVLQNRKFQMVFTTSNKLYVVDVLGRNVEGFPVSVAEKITNGVSVMDYDKNGNYRFLISVGSKLVSYKKNGKIVEGWVNPQQKNKVTNEIKHLVFGGKDYIMVKDVEGNLYFYNRRGEIRHEVSSKFNGNINEIILGSEISKTRVIYLDTSTNSIKKQYLSQEPIQEILNPSEKVKQFYYLNFMGDKAKEYVLISEKDIVVYGIDKVFRKRIPIDKGYRKLHVNEGSVTYINSFNELIFISNKMDKTFNLGIANGYKWSKYKEKNRFLILNGSSVRFVII